MNSTQLWTYKGVDVFRNDPNSYGLRWYCRTPNGMLRADTKANMRQFITACLAPVRPAAQPTNANANAEGASI